jgi:hypothetical protein
MRRQFNAIMGILGLVYCTGTLQKKLLSPFRQVFIPLYLIDAVSYPKNIQKYCSTDVGQL